MKELQDFLSKYRQLVPPESSKKKILIEVIYSECGVRFKKEELSIVRGGVMLSCHPTVRAEVAQCAPAILQTLYSKHNIHLNFIR